MTPERLDHIEHRVKKNQSAPDLPELCLELCAAVRAGFAPPPTPVVVPEPAPAPAFDPETGLRNEPDAPAATPPARPRSKK